VGENDLDAGYIMLDHDVIIYEFLERLGILFGLCYFDFECCGNFRSVVQGLFC